jgi:hypothetical protein
MLEHNNLWALLEYRVQNTQPTEIKTMAIALKLLKARIAQGEFVLTAAKAVSEEMGFGPSGYAKLVMAYQEENDAHNWTR